MQAAPSLAESVHKFTYLKSANAEYIDSIFADYLKNPDLVDETWRYFFEGMEIGIREMGAVAAPAAAPASVGNSDEGKVLRLILAYRNFGRLAAQLDPLSPAPQGHPFLELNNFELSDADLSRTFQAGKFVGLSAGTLKDLIAHLKRIYCGTIGFESAHMQDPAGKQWVIQKFEAARASATHVDTETKKFIFSRLAQSEGFERFLHTRYVAQKRFSLEGGESTIPTLDCIIEKAAELGATEFVMGMAHRGRLNVLTHIFGKPYTQMFTEFEGTYKSDLSLGEGDVKYHKGYSLDFTTRKGKEVHLSLAANPSHLEFVNPVVEGAARAKQDRIGDREGKRVVPVAIHGDAAFAGQGVCYETLNLAALDGYRTGGTIHLVINNQVGFTTSPHDSRSTTYCTDLGKMMDSPIFHVNADDPEAVWTVAEIATEWRQTFGRDVFIDLICYRKHGHNEGDEPAFTQPVMYKKIKTQVSTREAYQKRLLETGVHTEATAEAALAAVAAKLDEAHKKVKQGPDEPVVSVFDKSWKGLKRPDEKDIHAPAKTEVKKDKLLALAKKLNTIPTSFHLHPKLTRFFEARLKAVEEGKGIDWGNGEALAFATLLDEGFLVRLSGQDAERGTFGHRHSVLNDFETGERYTPFNSLSEKQGRYEVHNSHLSETGVMGFEYGYSLAAPQSLVIWEAQFGDFANGAQVIIDQFISTSESKWQRMSGLTLLLPHGYEGQGPEHSSARLERFLTLCAKDNMSICNLTTPAQFFHALRRQLHRNFRRPLVIMSPKSMLRNPEAVSDLSEFSDEGFRTVIDCRMGTAKPKSIKKVLICSGKVYYDLLSERTKRNLADVAIVRLEQIYPWPGEVLAKILNQYSDAKDLVWVQEEPRNMGAWPFVSNQWNGGFGDYHQLVGERRIRYVGRGAGISPAVGSPKIHEKELKDFLEQAFGS